MAMHAGNFGVVEPAESAPTKEAEPQGRSGPCEKLPDEYSWLEGGQNYVVCVFYTEDYLQYVLDLKRSLERNSVNHFLKLYEKRDSWEATTRIKPHFLLECLSRFPQLGVLYVDADFFSSRFEEVGDQSG